MTNPLTSTQKVQNLIARHMKSQTSNLSAYEYTHLMDTISDTGVMLRLLKEDLQHLKKLMSTLGADDLQKLNDLVMVTTGEGGAVRRVPQLLQHIMPQVPVLSRYQDGIRTLGDHLLQEGVTAFIHNFNTLKGSDEAPGFGVW